MFYPSARHGTGGQRRRRRRNRRAAGARQRGSARVVPHRLGRRSHDQLARLARCRRRLVLLDELSGPAPSVGSADVGTRSCRLARRAASCRLHRGRNSARSDPRRQAATLEGVVRRHPGVQLRGPCQLGSGDLDGRSGSRGQRPQRHRVRADRRSARQGAGRDRRREVGATMST